MRWNFFAAWAGAVTGIVLWAVFISPRPECIGYTHDGHDWSLCKDRPEHLWDCRLCLRMDGNRGSRERDSFELWMDSVMHRYKHQVDSLWEISPEVGKIDSLDLMYWQPSE